MLKYCEVCGKSFNVKPSKFNVRFCCSRICGHERKKKRKIMHCLLCGRKFEYKPSQVHKNGRKYCSRICRTRASRTRVQLRCLVCGKQYYSIKSNYKKSKYCSNFCRGRSMRVVKRPTKEQFKSLLLQTNQTVIAKLYGISVSSVWRWRKDYDLI